MPLERRPAYYDHQPTCAEVLTVEIERLKAQLAGVKTIVAKWNTGGEGTYSEDCMAELEGLFAEE